MFRSYTELKREVCGIRKTSASIPVVVHLPKTEEGKQELKKRVADIHADLIIHQIQKLPGPSAQQVNLLNAIIITIRDVRT